MSNRCREVLAFIHILFLATAWIFLYNIPGALEKSLMVQYHLNAYQFSAFYSAPQWPNSVLVLTAGYLTDKVFGLKKGTVLYSSISVSGLALFSIGGWIESYPVMLIGRIIFGVAVEATCISIYAYVILWFQGSKLNTVFAVVLSLDRFGALAVYLLAEPLKRLLSTVLSDSLSIKVTIIIVCSPGLLLLWSAIVLSLLKSPSDQKNESLIDLNSQRNVVRLKDILSMPLEFWSLSIVCAAYHVAIYTFLSFSQNGLVEEYKVSVERANVISSSFNLIAAVISPIIGYIIDKILYNLWFTTISSFMAAFAFGLLTFTNVTPYLCVTLLAISFSMNIASAYPMFSWVGGANKMASIYGVMISVSNLFLAAGSLIAGCILDRYSFHVLLLFFFLLVISCTLLLGLIWILDRKKDLRLNYMRTKM